MGIIVDLIEEIRNRLETDFGGDLTEIKRVRIGSVESARKLQDYPIINITVDSEEEDPRFIQKGHVIPLLIEVRLLAAKPGDESNKLYKTSDTSGALFLLENILNVLDKDTSGNVDLNFSNTANSLRRFVWTIEETNDLIEIPITISVETLQFIAGSR